MNNFLYTGVSGIGKSTLLKSCIKKYHSRKIKWFYSDVIYSEDVRMGWSICSPNFERVLIHRDINSEFRLGSSFGVDFKLYEEVIEEQLEYDPNIDLYFIDEIGIVASWSDLFIKKFNRLLDSPTKVLAVYRKKGSDHISQILKRNDTIFRELKNNHEELKLEIDSWVNG